MAMLRPAILLFILLALVTGGVYPLVTTALGQWWFADQANGSLIRQEGEIRGSRLIGQDFTAPGYFHGRPSATAESPYNPLASGGSNLAGSNPELDNAVRARIAALRVANPQASQAVPVELVTAGLQSDAAGRRLADPPRGTGASAHACAAQPAGGRTYAKTAVQRDGRHGGQHC